MTGPHGPAGTARMGALLTIVGAVLIGVWVVDMGNGPGPAGDYAPLGGFLGIGLVTAGLAALIAAAAGAIRGRDRR